MGKEDRAQPAPDRLMQLASGFMEAKVLLAGAELGVFDILAGGHDAPPRGPDTGTAPAGRTEPGATAAAVAGAIGGSLRGTEVLLDALTALGVVEKTGELYRNRPELEPFLTARLNPDFLGMLRHRNRMYRTWDFLEEKITGKPLPDILRGRALLSDPQANENFIRAMYAGGLRNAPIVADHVDLTRVRALADLGGGPGHYLAEFARRAPDATPYLVDLPLTLRTARSILAHSDVFGRIRFLEWDFYNDPPPPAFPSFDLIFISAVLHAESPERNRELLRKLNPFVLPGGRIVIQENMVEPGRTAPVEAAMFAVNMLASTEGGRTYTKDEISDWGRDAGFEPGAFERLSPRSCLLSLRKAA